MTLFRHWKARSTGLWFPQIKVSPMTVPAYSLESFQTMAWGGWWWGGLGSSSEPCSRDKSEFQEAKWPSMGQSLEEERTPAKPELWSGRRQSPTERWATCVWTNTWDQEKATESSKPNNPRADKAGDHSLCSYQPEVGDLLPHRASRPHESLGIELSWPLTTGWSGSLLTKLKTKA